MKKIKITAGMLTNDVAPISLRNIVNNNGEMLVNAMQANAKRKQIKLIANFWNYHEPLTVIQDSLLYKMIIAYYKEKTGKFLKSADKYIHGFINNTNTGASRDNRNGFFFHVNTDYHTYATTKEIFQTLLNQVGTINDFIEFVNNHVGY